MPHSYNIGSPLSLAGVSVLIIALALALVLVVALMEPIYAGVLAGFLLLPFFIKRVALTISITLVLGLIVSGLLQIFIIDFDKRMIWGVAVLGFIVLLSAMISGRSNIPAVRSPTFVRLASLFILYAVLVSVLNLYSIDEFILAFKRYFQMMGIIFALAWISFDAKAVSFWKKLMVVVACIQLPFALYELLILVPFREGFTNIIPGLVPVDVVAGTFGADILGGGANSEMATFLIMVLAFLLSYKKYNLLTNKLLFLVSVLVIPPLLLGETKIVLILLPIMFLLLYRREIVSKMHKALVALALGGLLTVVAGNMYLLAMGLGFDDFVLNSIGYNIGDIGYGLNELNRKTVLSFWAEKQGFDQPLAFLFGNGLGSSHSATLGHIAINYPGYGIDLTAISVLLWDVGIVGVILFLSIFVFALKVAGKIERETRDNKIKADTAALKISIVLILINLFFDRSALEVISWQIIFSLAFGYLALIYRNHQKIGSVRKW